MTFEEKLKNQEYDRIWQEYCGFLELDMDAYMGIQNRLLEEQMRLWCSSPLGKKILKGRVPGNIQEFRQIVPLYSYFPDRRFKRAGCRGIFRSSGRSSR